MLLAKTFCVLFVAHYRDGEGLKGGAESFFILVVAVLGVGSIQQCSYLDIFFCFYPTIHIWIKEGIKRRGIFHIKGLPSTSFNLTKVLEVE